VTAQLMTGARPKLSRTDADAAAMLAPVGAAFIPARYR
jgi:hypothetical protein